jgi:hypothetical protein
MSTMPFLKVPHSREQVDDLADRSVTAGGRPVTAGPYQDRCFRLFG